MRRSVLLVVFAVLLSACDWPMLGGNAGHTGYNLFERTINGGNAYQLREAWTAPFPTSPSRTSPVVAAGVLYVTRDKLLYAFAANGGTNCSGALRRCSPLWTATFGANVGGGAAVANGFVYVPAGNTLYAFDASGSTNCSGTPKRCGPVWTATGSDLAGEPVPAGGFVYIDMANLSSNTLYVFEGRGETGCTATNPRTCAPLWTAPGASVDFDPLPAIGGGRVLVGDQVYDAAGQQNCSGAPKSCSPLWQNHAQCSTGAFCSIGHAVVSGGRAFYGATGQGPPFPPTPATSRLMAFDASGVAQCGGVPKTCQPLWDWDLSGSMSAAAVANGLVYVSTADFRSDTLQELGALYAFAADGCCAPFWSTGLGAEGAGLAVANGVLYMERRGNAFEPFASYFTAIDLADRTVEQSVGYPTVITDPIIANGIVYFADDTALRAFELP